MTKKLIFLLFFSALIFSGTAFAITQTPFDMYTPYGDNFNFNGDQIAQLDFASSYGVAINANALRPGGPDDPFNFIFQSNITGFKDVNGKSAAQPFLNFPANAALNQYEYTIVGSIWETAQGLGATGATFDLATAPAGQSNFFEIYADVYDGSSGAGAQSNLNSGSGFYDGTLIMRAEAVSGFGLFTVDTDSNSNGVPDNQDLGAGSTKVIWKVTDFDQNYFDFGFDPTNPDMILYSQFDGTLNLPPDADGNDIVMWNGYDPDFFTGLDDGTTPFNTDDFLFQLDGFKIFQPTVVPEPSTMLLLGVGLIGLAGIVRKK